MSKDGPSARFFDNSFSTATLTEQMDELKEHRSNSNSSSSNNNNNNSNNIQTNMDTTTTAEGRPDGAPTESTAKVNNPGVNKTVSAQQGQQTTGNKQQRTSPTTSSNNNNNNAHTHKEYPNPTTTTITTTTTTSHTGPSNYTPNRKHGVIFEAMDGLTIEQYLRAIADTIGGINIKYASRLSGGRICVYLAAESFVQELCAPGGINISDSFIPCRPYVMASRRVVLSNVLPDIPNETLLPLLHTFGKPTSHISQLSISTTHADLKHIKSFRRLVYMLIPSMEKIPSTINVEYDGVKYVIYVTCDDVTCVTCHKPGHVAQNCHTKPQSRLGPITFADLAAGRRGTHLPPQISVSTPPDSNITKQAPSMENKTTFPVLTQPRQRLRVEDDESVSSKMNPLDSVTNNPTPKTKPISMYTRDVEQGAEHHPDPETMDTATPAMAVDLSTPHTLEIKKTGITYKQQPPKNKQEQPENGEDKGNKDMDSSSANDSDDQQELPRSQTTAAPRDKTTLADHKAIDNLCDALKAKGNQPITVTTFSHFLKACRRQKDPRVIAKEHTTNITGLVYMLEENLVNTRDYNLRRRMKRIIDSLKI
jgi:hypothetical protein